MQERGYEQCGGVDVTAEEIMVANALRVRHVMKADLASFLAERREGMTE